MTRVLVIQGAGMNMRGKAQVEVFGTTTLEGWTWSYFIPISKAR